MSIKHSLRSLNIILAAVLLLISSVCIIKLNDSFKKIEIFAFLENGVDKERIEEIKVFLTSLKNIDSVQFFPPDKTVKLWAKTSARRGLMSLLEENLFPSLFQIKLKKTASRKGLRHLCSAVKKIQGIKMVEYGGERTEEAIKRTKRYLFISLFVFFAALVNILDHLFILPDKK